MKITKRGLLLALDTIAGQWISIVGMMMIGIVMGMSGVLYYLDIDTADVELGGVFALELWIAMLFAWFFEFASVIIDALWPGFIRKPDNEAAAA